MSDLRREEIRSIAAGITDAGYNCALRKLFWS